jgi:hypothetical protein
LFLTFRSMNAHKWWDLLPSPFPSIFSILAFRSLFSPSLCLLAGEQTLCKLADPGAVAVNSKLQRAPPAAARGGSLVLAPASFAGSARRRKLRAVAWAAKLASGGSYVTGESGRAPRRAPVRGSCAAESSSASSGRFR